jgi:hypothetical protein
VQSADECLGFGPEHVLLIAALVAGSFAATYLAFRKRSRRGALVASLLVAVVIGVAAWVAVGGYLFGAHCSA